jgi:pilus assembly protein TadC
MLRKPVTILTYIGALVGAAGLAYVVLAVPPYEMGGDLSVVALLLFFASLFLLAASLGTLAALAAHQRWPSLAGRRQRLRRDSPPAVESALRQGILFGIVVATLMALSILRVLDITFALVTFLLAGLVEAYAQTRV